MRKCNRSPSINGVKGPAYVLGVDGQPQRVTRSMLLSGDLPARAVVVYGAGRPVTASDFATGTRDVLLTSVSEAAASIDPARALRQRALAHGVDLSVISSTSSDADDVAWSSNDWCFSRPGQIEAADIVVTRDGAQGVEVLCIRRSHPPFSSTWALPGGLRDEGESLATAADRELEEETGLQAGELGERRWLGELTATDWDPRAVSAHVGAAHYHVAQDVNPVAADDAVEARWVPIESIASGVESMAFGHAHWLAVAFAADQTVAAKLDIVAEASRRRNHRIAALVNQVRRKADQQLIALPASRGSWATPRRLDAFDSLSMKELHAYSSTNADSELAARAGAGLLARHEMATMDVAAVLHEQWRATYRQQVVEAAVAGGRAEETLTEADFARMKDDGNGGQVDIFHTPFSEIPLKWQGENVKSARGAIGAALIEDAEDEVAAAVHEQWLERNGEWADETLKVPYGELPEIEKEKGRIVARLAMAAASSAQQ